MKAIIILFMTFNLYASSECPNYSDTVVIGDSQVGATWSRSYVGNYLQQCLKGEFYIYGRGATVLSSWIGKGSMDKIETIQRSQVHAHLNLGNFEKVPKCKKRIRHILKTHRPQKIVFNFGGNMIGLKDTTIADQTNKLTTILKDFNIQPENCFFITPTFEMEVESRRNIPGRNLKNVLKVTKLIKRSLNDSCTLISGVDLMKVSDFFDGNELLKRVVIPGDIGCSGAAKNDNVHICGEAAKDFANRICKIINIIN